MKRTFSLLTRISIPALACGVLLMLADPAALLAQRGGGRGGSFGGSHGGGRSYARPSFPGRGYSGGGRTYASQSYSWRGYSGGNRSTYVERGVPRGGYSAGRFYAGRGYYYGGRFWARPYFGVGIGIPFGWGYYSEAGCGYYDGWGDWWPAPCYPYQRYGYRVYVR